MRASKTLIVCLLGLMPLELKAGPYTDLLGRCLVDSTSTRDRQALVRWMIAGMSVHPAVRGFVSVDQGSRTTADQELAAVFEHLLLESCREETADALRYEGDYALELAFQLLGQVAASELTSDPEVTQTMMGFTNYVDFQRLEATFGPLE